MIHSPTGAMAFLELQWTEGSMGVVWAFALLQLAYLACDLDPSSCSRAVTRDLFRYMELVLDRLTKFYLTDLFVRRAASINLEKYEIGKFSRKTWYSSVISRSQISTSIFFFYQIATVECFVVGPFYVAVQAFPWIDVCGQVRQGRVWPWCRRNLH